MNLGLLSDLHLRTNAPDGRIDDFSFVQYLKVQYVFGMFKKHNCQIILQAGDMFDNPNPSNFLLVQYINLFNDFGIPICCVAGQHDISYWNLDTLGRSALAVIEAGVPNFQVLREEPVVVSKGNNGDRFTIYGCSWGQNFPKAVRQERNILILHAPIGDEKLFPEHKLQFPMEVLNERGSFELILCGDYHYAFETKKDNRTIINTGCLVRLSRDDRDMFRQPKFAIYNTDTRGITWYNIPIADANSVFKAKDEIKVNPKLQEFINALSGEKKSKGDFKENLQLVYTERKTEDEIKDIITEVMEKQKI